MNTKDNHPSSKYEGWLSLQTLMQGFNPSGKDHDGLLSSLRIPESKPIKLKAILNVDSGACWVMQSPQLLITVLFSVAMKRLPPAVNAVLAHKKIEHSIKIILLIIYLCRI